MPQTTPERAARWPGMDRQAMLFLKSRGYRLTKDWCWTHPERKEPDEREADAIIYLIEEWDFDGLIRGEPEGED